MRGERSYRGAEMFSGGLDPKEKVVRFEIVEDGVAGGSRDGMSLVGETVFESAGAAREGVGDLSGNEDSAERCVTAGNSLPRENDVWLDGPVLDSEGFTGTAQAGHNFVGNKQNAVVATDFGDAREVAFRRSCRAERRADDGLKNESCGGGRIGLCEMSFEIVRAGDAAARKCLVERAAVAKTRRDVAPLGEKRQIGFAASDVAADGHRAQRAAVIALAAGNDPVASGLADFEKILARELDSSVARFGTTGREVDAASAKVGRSECKQARCQFFGRRGMELRGVREGKLRSLSGHGAGDFWNAVADVDDGSLAGSIQEFAAVAAVDPAAIAAIGDWQILAEMAREDSGVVGHARVRSDCSRVTDARMLRWRSAVAFRLNRKVLLTQSSQRKRRMMGMLRAARGVLFVVTTCTLCVGVASAQTAKNPAHLIVDLREAPKHIFHAKLTLPVAAGPLTLVYPKWIPGEHAPVGPIVDLTGLVFRASGKEIAWRRDEVDMYALKCQIPPGASELEVSLDYVSPSGPSGGRENASATAQLALLNWYTVLLYPYTPGVKTDDLPYAASVQLPAGWKYGTALEVAKQSAEEIEFQPVSLTMLVDSPVLAGAHMRTIDLSPGQKPEHRIHIAAEGESGLQVPAETVQQWRQLVAETGVLFSARHYRHYDFLLSVTDNMDNDGVEHHESSDNRVPGRIFLDESVAESMTDLLPHEFAHSWNGKYRRPAGLATPNYQEPMRGGLLWVYEGMTQYWGTILSARIGAFTPEKLRENLAWVAAYLDKRAGRVWRDLEDTAISSQVLYASPQEYRSWRREADYYDEGTLIWLEADTIIRKESAGKKSLDDFCKSFAGGPNSGPKIVPYTFDDVVAAINVVQPYDWRKFFAERIESHGPGAPLGGLENSGWRLIYNETPNDNRMAQELPQHLTDLQFSLGILVHDPGGDGGDEIIDVNPGSPAAKAGIAPGMKLLAVNGRRWNPDELRAVIRRAKGGSEPIELLIENEDFFHTYEIDYHGGERYPHLERINGKPDLLSEIIKMRAPAVPPAKD